MNGWDLFTWAMIAVLAVGSLAVFLAFLVDARELLRNTPRASDADAARRGVWRE
jgi:hypothetical protein